VPSMEGENRLLTAFVGLAGGRSVLGKAVSREFNEIFHIRLDEDDGWADCRSRWCFWKAVGWRCAFGRRLW